jgi:IQ calmodulin-binding motif
MHAAGVNVHDRVQAVLHHRRQRARLAGMTHHIILIQASMRMVLARRHFQEMRRAAQCAA